MQKLHHQGNKALAEYRREHQEQTDALVAWLGQIVGGWQESECDEQRIKTIGSLIGDDAETIREQCEAHMGYAGNNYLPFLPPLFRNYRKLCLDIIEFLQPTSTSVDTTLEQAIAFVLRHRQARAERLPVTSSEPNQEEPLDLSWIPPRWWKAVTGRSRRDVPVLTVDRKYLELCVLSCAVRELKSVDLCIAGSERFSDYRDQLVTWEEYYQLIETYCEQVGMAADATQFVNDLQSQLTHAIETTDMAFPTNMSLTIKEGEPVLRRLDKLPEPEGFALIERLLHEWMPECNILDIISVTAAGVANLVVFHNVVSMARVLQELVDEGYVVTPEIVARMSPYMIGHINRFGKYEPHFDHIPQPVVEEIRLSPHFAVSMN